MRLSIIVTLFCVFALVHNSAAADIQIVEHETALGSWNSYKLEGEIVSEDANRVRFLLSNYSERFTPLFQIESPGGDVLEAMEIGKIFREHEVRVIVESGGCYSSCTLVLAGAVLRDGNGPIGVHRPHFAETLDEDSIDSAYRGMLAAVHEYADYMNVPGDFVELMFSVSPDEMIILSEEQYRKYMPFEDPVSEAKNINTRARRYGISPGTYRKRWAFADQECTPKIIHCVDAVLYGVSRQVYEEWWTECLAAIDSMEERNGKIDSSWLSEDRFYINCQIPKPWENK